MASQKKNLQGLVAATITPMTEHGEINLSVIGQYVDYLVEKQGVKNIFGFGATTVETAEKSTLNPGCIGYPAWISERPNWLRFASTMLITWLLRKVLSKGYGGEKVPEITADCAKLCLYHLSKTSVHRCVASKAHETTAKATNKEERK
ncbi:N-acetylneuraminate lyase [Myotis davidii]|uniref:N-acetylneuraminate lyase n=1 Tax=Myotis davidii TaxID=225400 RepID=L5LIY2_MYODS|nr:N-acetylneuraminate lyase [Myotis davidii]